MYNFPSLTKKILLNLKNLKSEPFVLKNKEKMLKLKPTFIFENIEALNIKLLTIEVNIYINTLMIPNYSGPVETETKVSHIRF